MSASCNWENRVRRESKPIISDGAWLGMEVISTPSGNTYPVTHHIEHHHTFESRYERATYVWDRDGNSKRIAIA